MNTFIKTVRHYLNKLIKWILGHLFQIIFEIIVIILLVVLWIFVSPYINRALKKLTPDKPIIHIMFLHEGISSQDAEQLLIKPMEQELRGLEGVKKIWSHTFEKNVDIGVEFTEGFSSDKAKSEVQNRVDAAQEKLPKGKKPHILKEQDVKRHEYSY